MRRFGLLAVSPATPVSELDRNHRRRKLSAKEMHHAAAGERRTFSTPDQGLPLQLGKTSEGKYRTFWLGQNRAVADYHAHNLKGQFTHMRMANRDVWTEEDLAGIAQAVATFKEMIASVRGNLTRDEAALSLRRRIIDDTFGGAEPASPTGRQIKSANLKRPRPPRRCTLPWTSTSKHSTRSRVRTLTRSALGNF